MCAQHVDCYLQYLASAAGHTMAPPTCDVMPGRPEQSKAVSNNIAPGKKVQKIQGWYTGVVKIQVR